MKSNFTKQLAVLLICLCAIGAAQANNYVVGNQTELLAAVSSANSIPSTNAAPHNIVICAGGNYYFPNLQQPMNFHGPKDQSAHFSGFYFNFGQSLSGKHFAFYNITFVNQSGSSFGSCFMSSNGGGSSFLSNCRFSNSSAQHQAGGLFNNGDTVSLYACTFDGNFTTDGGGEGGAAVFNNFGSMVINNCTFSGNNSASTSATGGGGAVKNHAGGNMVVMNSTFYNNHSASRGGAISNQGGGVCAIANNIFVGNTAASGGNDLFGTFTSLYGCNIIGDVTNATLTGVTTGNITGVSAASVINTTLADNGHFTWTHALVNGSVAINSASSTASVIVDQREYTRTGAPDIGSHEYNGGNPCVGFSTSINEISPGSNCTPVMNDWTSVTTPLSGPINGSYWFDGTNYICGDTLHFFGSGTFIYMVQDANNCVAKDTVSINYNAPPVNYNFTICTGDSVTVNGTTYNSTGSYQQFYGCDSVVNVTVSNPGSIPNVYHYFEVCPGSSVTVNGTTYNSLGTFYQYYSCDSVVEVEVASAAQEIDNFITVCYGQNVTVGNNTYNTSGTYTDAFGCDSLVTTHLTVKPEIMLPNVSVTDIVCHDDQGGALSLTSTTNMVFTIGGSTYTFGGDTTWADVVLGFSTQYSSNSWSAQQLLGPPNVYPNYGDIAQAWTADDYGNDRDWLIVGYTTPVVANQILIYETDNPGVIDTVYVREYPSGNWSTVYTATAANGPAVATIFAVNLPTTMTIDAVRWAIATDIAVDWVEYDAVGLVAAGDDTVTITVDAGEVLPISVTQNGCTISDNIIVPNPPVLLNVSANNDTVCNGTSTTLIAAGSVSYNWSNGFTTASQVVTPNSSTTYSVTATDAFGCVDSVSIDVTVLPVSPVSVSASDDTICSGENVTLTASGSGAYMWSSGGGGATITVSPTSTTAYTVTGTSANGCIATDLVVVVVEVCDDVKNVEISAVSLYPNPTNGNIRFSGLAGDSYILSIYNSMGELISSETLANDHISIAAYASGCYLMVLKSSDSTTHFKVLKD